MDHSYEEIRNAAIDILADREKVQFPPSRYEFLESGVAEVLARRQDVKSPSQTVQGQQLRLPEDQALLCQEVFWDLFRQGIITIGSDTANREFPWFRVSSYGKQLLDNQNLYFFHDVASYEKVVTDSVPGIDATTLLYLKEAMQAFRSGCILSATVMIGVAAEHAFLSLLEVIEANPTHKSTFRNALAERLILRKFNAFRKAIDSQIPKMPHEIQEGIDTQLSGTLDIIRTFRNESGHPSRKIISREQCYVLLNLYVPYCKKIYQLMKYYKA